MKKYIHLLFLLCLTGNALGQNQENSKAENLQLIEWSKRCIQQFFNVISSDTLIYEPKEWILIVQDALYPIKVEQKPDTLRGCIKLLDNREVFDQYQEISEDPNAFIAISLAYDIISKRTDIKVVQSETTFILDKKGIVLEFYNYVRPIAIRQMITMQTLNIKKNQVHKVLGQDTTNSKWHFQADIQNWVLQRNNKILFQWTPLELVYFNQKYIKKSESKSLIRIKDDY